MFTKILYINLERRKDRKEYIEEQIKRIDWQGDVERINAVDGRNLNLDEVSDLLSARASTEASDNTPRQFAPGSVMTRGAVGCALSHRDAFLNILNGDHQKVLILEDDIYFDDLFFEKLNNYKKDIPEYDLLYLGHHDARESIEYNNILMKANYLVFGLFGYVVDKKIAHMLVNMYPINGQVDSEIRKIYPYIKAYHLKDDLRIIHSEHSFTNKLGTDIQLIENFSEVTESTSCSCTNNNYMLKEIVIFMIIIFLIYLFLYRRLSNA
jgi:GR25 family glycosyltransferase involved in LPS biosynthesis